MFDNSLEELNDRTKDCPYCGKHTGRRFQYKTDARRPSTAIRQYQALQSIQKNANEGNIITAAIQAGLVVIGQLGIVKFYFCTNCHRVFR